MLLFKLIALVAFLHSLGLRAVHAVPVTTDTTTDLEPAWPEEKRQARPPRYFSSATLGIICYKETTHVAIVAVYPDGSSARWHSPDISVPGGPKRWEVSVERKDGPPWELRNFLQTRAKKAVRMIGEVQTLRLQETLNGGSLLPRGRDENCWWYLHRGLKALVRIGAIDEDAAHKAYTGLKLRTVLWRNWGAPRWRDAP